MPKFLKDTAITLLNGGVESYLLALYGMTIPSTRVQNKQETKYAPVIGLFGASAELLIKACLVQAKGSSAMYRDGDASSGVYRFGTEVIEELRKEIRDATPCVSYLWKNVVDYGGQQRLLLHYLDKFKLLQELRASGLHAGIGCSRDITVSVANDMYNFVLLLAQGKKLKAYLKNIPTPQATIRDREAIIEDLTRRMNTAKEPLTKTGFLRNMYLVLPYIPEIEPDWIGAFDKIAVAPPTMDDVSYLTKTLSDAHSIYLLKNRGGKDGIPVRVEPNNPDALPIAIQNIKRTLSTIPDKFHNDIITANARLDEKRLDLPIDDFLIDLYALGLDNAQVLTAPNKKLTAQQVWPFIVAAYSTAGTPRPCWFFVRACDEISQLISYLHKAENIANGYFKRRVSTVISSLHAMQHDLIINLNKEIDPIFKEVDPYIKSINNLKSEQLHPFSPAFLRRYPLGDAASTIIREFVADNQNAGDTLAALLKLDILNDNEKKAASALIPLCLNNENKHGLIAILRTEHMSGRISQARKLMFFSDFIKDGPKLEF
ncbi:MAG TPA: hypothetical protein VM577_09615 [Anaerovoracaceae bacterium]|nr:hypothetical protein [Anaerovoracaceae bacterium]